MNGAFGMRRARRRPSINITSLVDVMFILLLFLMVSTTFRGRQGIDIRLPEAQTGTTRDEQASEITVTRDGAYRFGGQPVDEAGLRRALGDLLRKDPEAGIVLRADAGAEFGPVVRAIDVARELGGKQLIIPTRPPEPATP